MLEIYQVFLTLFLVGTVLSSLYNFIIDVESGESLGISVDVSIFVCGTMLIGLTWKLLPHICE